MISIQEIFSGEFADATLAVIQKLHSDERNLTALNSGFTENWPPLPPERPADVFVLSIGKDGSKCREIWIGYIKDIQPSTAPRFRFYVDRFRRIGEHDLGAVSDAIFYGNGGGGGARNYAENLSQTSRRKLLPNPLDLDVQIAGGENELRLVWVRKNHGKFRDPVWSRWEGKCAVTGADCNGLLVASHIHPWAKSTPKEKTDPDNGLLLSVPLDKLFDRGWISFSNYGELLIKPLLSPETRSIFGVSEKNMRLKRMEKVTNKMLAYIERHRNFHGFD